MNFILASQSPRRQELLKYVIDNFECLPADIEEILPKGIDPLFAPEYLSVQKCVHIAKQHPTHFVIGSDTAVFLGDIMLGKPKNREHAKTMLKMLSGNTHKVITGCAFCFDSKTYSFSDTSLVEFYTLSESEIDEYLDTGEYADKAGAYGIQGFGSVLVRRIEGDFFNIVGLPVARLKREMQKFIENVITNEEK